jgi:hypothetical protein
MPWGDRRGHGSESYCRPTGTLERNHTATGRKILSVAYLVPTSPGYIHTQVDTYLLHTIRPMPFPRRARRHTHGNLFN